MATFPMMLFGAECSCLRERHKCCAIPSKEIALSSVEDDRSRPGRAWDYAEVFILTKIFLYR